MHSLTRKISIYIIHSPLFPLSYGSYYLLLWRCCSWHDVKGGWVFGENIKINGNIEITSWRRSLLRSPQTWWLGVIFVVSFLLLWPWFWCFHDPWRPWALSVSMNLVYFVFVSSRFFRSLDPTLESWALPLLKIVFCSRSFIPQVKALFGPRGFIPQGNLGRRRWCRALHQVVPWGFVPQGKLGETNVAALASGLFLRVSPSKGSCGGVDDAALTSGWSSSFCLRGFVP